MANLPPPVERFLSGRRIAIAGVSRESGQAANIIFKKLAGAGYEVIPVNPKTTEVDGVRCYPDLASVPGEVDGVVVATHSKVAADVVRQCAERGVKQIWFHRSFGDGSVSEEAVRECEARGIEPIVGGCPMMFCAPVDPVHACMRWFLQWRGRVPK
jgi:hypothetical protein